MTMHRSSDLDWDDWLNRELSAPADGSGLPRVCFLHTAIQPCQACADKRVEDHIERSRRLRRSEHAA